MTPKSHKGVKKKKKKKEEVELAILIRPQVKSMSPIYSMV